MATLSGNKVKDTYQSLLKLESNGVGATLKAVEDGNGTATALKVSDAKVEVEALGFSAAPTASTTEATALLVDGSNNVVTRELNDIAFTGTVKAAPEVVIGYVDADLTLSGTYQTVVYASVDNLNQANSYHMGYAPAAFTFQPTAGDIENRSTEDLVVRVSITSTIDITSHPCVVAYKLQRYTTSWADEKLVERAKASTGTTIDSFWGTFVLAPAEKLRVQMAILSGNADLKIGTQVEFREEILGDI